MQISNLFPIQVLPLECLTQTKHKAGSSLTLKRLVLNISSITSAVWYNCNMTISNHPLNNQTYDKVKFKYSFYEDDDDDNE